MTVKELYKRFLLMINKNDTNEGVSIPPAHFVLLYNAEILRWLNEQLKKDLDNIDANMLQNIFITDFPLTVTNKTSEFIEFAIPDNFFQGYGAYCLADRGPCKGVKIFAFEKKPGNLIPVLDDEFSKASFDYQEAPYVLTQNNLKIYFDDFKIQEAFFNYYREPRQIDIEGYTRFDGTASTNIDPDLDDRNCVEILSRVAAEVERETDNVEGLNLSKDRINTEY